MQPKHIAFSRRKLAGECIERGEIVETRRIWQIAEDRRIARRWWLWRVLLPSTTAACASASAPATPAAARLPVSATAAMATALAFAVFPKSPLTTGTAILPLLPVAATALAALLASLATLLATTEAAAVSTVLLLCFAPVICRVFVAVRILGGCGSERRFGLRRFGSRRRRLGFVALRLRRTRFGFRLALALLFTRSRRFDPHWWRRLIFHFHPIPAPSGLG
ncbi:MAG: hypothetical protein ABIZ49_12245 [Opitutaceae bacterium]